MEKYFLGLINLLTLQKIKKVIKYSDSIFWDITKLTKNYTLVLFTRHGIMFDKIFQDNLENNVIVFTDKKKLII